MPRSVHGAKLVGRSANVHALQHRAPAPHAARTAHLRSADAQQRCQKDSLSMQDAMRLVGSTNRLTQPAVLGPRLGGSGLGMGYLHSWCLFASGGVSHTNGQAAKRVWNVIAH
jgi:hypothetical protein